MKEVKAVIADDEPALRDFLERKLSALWPELTICGIAGDGPAALELAKTHAPDIAFLDIKMPGLSGIEVAQRLPETCLPVFITAHDSFALKAFETGAIDYLLKPVTDLRLEQTVKRLKSRVAQSSLPVHDLHRILQGLTLATPSSPRYLQWLKVQDRESVRLLSANEIYYFRASDKYTTVKTRTREFLIKKSIKELAAELSPDQFWQIHRAILVNISTIDTVTRSLTGSYEVRVKDLQEVLPVSRSYSHMFKQM
ncbi:MAG TPA: LytTR family DNA-binding domain-containing protein [Geobacteraceae bacterium]|nr:LytTR family DNA-binding domain-containing protein [Geobacteraceae bacterium]